MNRKLKLAKGAVYVALESDNVKKAFDYLSKHKMAKMFTLMGFGMFSSIAFRTMLGAETGLFNPAVAFADVLSTDTTETPSLDIVEPQSVNAETTNEVVTTNAETTDAKTVTNETSEASTTETSKENTETSEEVKSTEETTAKEEITNEEDKKAETQSTKEEDKKVETQSTKKEDKNSSVEDAISKESKSGKYLKPVYAVDGVDTSDVNDANGKATFKYDKTNCIILTDSKGNTKIWTFDSYGGANHGVASNQETLINNLKNSELTHISKTGNHELVWPGFDYTDDNGLSHCKFDGGEIILNPDTNEYTVIYDKSKYVSTMGVETTEKYVIDPDKVDPSKPTEDNTDNPDKPNKPDKPDKPDKPNTPDTPDKTTVVKTGDELDLTGIRNFGILSAVAGVFGTIGHKLCKDKSFDACVLLKDALMTNMDEKSADGFVKKYR